jgi:nucleotide-binding universal stress UspA family protein
MEITKIVVGVDFSPESEVAAKHALNVARHTGAELVLVHVGTVLETVGVPESMQASVREWEGIVREQMAEDRRRLGELRERLAGQGADVSHIVVDGFPDTGLVDAAKSLNADLVITGTHGRTGIKRFLLGSVSERVVRLSDASVMVVRPVGDGAGGYRRVLVPTDFAEPAERALQLALVMARQGAEVDLVHYWQLPVVAAGYYAPIKAADKALGPMRDAIAEKAESLGKELVDKYASDRVSLRFEQVQAAASYGIQDRLEDKEYDLVVMGSHGRRGVKRFVLGSVAEVTVRHAPCSVVVVHAPASGDR